jgi:spore photoproduct lyase
MNSLPFYNNFFKSIYITEEALSYDAAHRALKAFPGLPWYKIKTKEDIPLKDLHKYTLFIATSKGAGVKKCPGSKGHICCNYLTVDLYMGCLFNCSYCIMQGYLNFAPITVYVDTDKILAKIIKIRQHNPGSVIRLGSGEIGDSLALDPIFRLSQDFIRGLACYEDIFFELKTKTNFISHLLKLKPKGNAVIGFSLNPEQIITEEEPGTSSLKERLEAAVKAIESGYYVSLHFDPLILVDDWERLYRETVRKLACLDVKKIVWISLGTLRYTRTLREQMKERSYLYDEFVPCADGKYRYLKPLRSRAYRLMKEWISSIGDIPLYLCMESDVVWKNVFSNLPGKIVNLCAIFNKVKRLSF